MNKIKVLIIDDSAVVRQTLEEILVSDPQIEVVGTAGDPYLAVEKMKEVVPDVITLDVEMPRMDGITFLQKLMSQHPIPVVMCSSLTEEGSETTLRALEYGAVDIIEKPKMGIKQFIEESRILICDAVKGAFLAHKKKKPSALFHVPPKLSADAVLPKVINKSMVQTTESFKGLSGGTSRECAGHGHCPAYARKIYPSFCKQVKQHMSGICERG
jgi:two-component system chemotaxis response regulator CheB